MKYFNHLSKGLAFFDSYLAMYAVVAFVLSFLQIMFLLDLSLSLKIEAFSISFILLFITAYVFYFLFGVMDKIMRFAQSEGLVDARINWLILYELFSVCLIFGVFFHLIAYEWVSNQMLVEELPPVSWLPAAVGMYIAVRKFLKIKIIKK